jgi:hypothetical protein
VSASAAEACPHNSLTAPSWGFDQAAPQRLFVEYACQLCDRRFVTEFPWPTAGKEATL